MLRRHRRASRFAATLTVALALSASSSAIAFVAPAAAQIAPPAAAPRGAAVAAVCDHRLPAGRVHCDARILVDARGVPLATATPPPGALTPQQIRHAYGFDTLACATGSNTCGSGETIAIVDAYDDPTAAADLATFSTQFGLPAATFTKATPQGLPATDGGWSQEISLDVQWAHAVAPGAAILLVESLDNSYANLLGAVDYAAQQPGVHVVSMSWGGGESSTESGYDSHFQHAGVANFAAAGDGGNGAEYPSASPYVTSVGGTTLPVDSAGNRTGAETAWSCSSGFACYFYGGTGGGTSAYEPEPAYQTAYANPTISTGGKRATPDVAYDADPNTGVAVYDSTPYNGSSGWLQVGGTSAGSPQWAALAAIAHAQGASATTNTQFYNAGTGSAYASNYYDITSGQNGTCSVCYAGPGYDEVSGLGSPRAGALIPALAPAPAQPSLVFVNFPTSFTAGSSVSGQVQLRDLNGQPLAAASTVAVTLATTGSASFTPTSVSVAAGASTSGTFSYADTKAETATATASATGYTSANQAETIGAAAATTLTVSPATASVPQGGTQKFTASGTDAYGNAADTSGAAWSVSPATLGSVSPATGSATTFSASQTGGGTVTAAIAGGPSGGASVTVTAPPSDAVTNGGFETGSLSGWTIAATKPTPVVTTAAAHSGTYSALLGTSSGSEPKGDSVIQQQLVVPSTATPTLTFWYWPATTDTIRYDWQTVQIRNTSGSILATVMKVCSNARAWTQVSYDMSAYKGQTVVLWFDDHEDGYGDLTYMYVDDVSVK